MTDPDVLAARPFWRYVAVNDSRTRPAHRSWHNTLLPADHPWWETHYPPNGWNCRCRVVSMSAREMERDGLAVTENPDMRMEVKTDPRTGEAALFPAGIDRLGLQPGKVWPAIGARPRCGLSQTPSREVKKVIGSMIARLTDKTPAMRIIAASWSIRSAGISKRAAGRK
jgi:hypothetical protein